VAVGQDEDSVPKVRGSHIGRSHTQPFRIEPEAGKIGKYSAKLPASVVCRKPGHVFDHEPSGNSLA
jgi:hypothetical protein